MRALSPDRLELIDALVAEADVGGITAGILEKDEHLTDALHAVFKLKFEHASLVLCGGTSLSKAYGLIERMSEDADIKVVLGAAAAEWSKNKVRRYLGAEMRDRVAEALADIGFTEDADRRRSLNDNRYVHSQWAYQRRYDGVAALRPNLQIEWVVRRPVLSTEAANIGALADRLANRTGNSTQAAVVSVAETLAEKVLSFLRRFAQYRAGRMRQDWDTALVRHIYDSHCIVKQVPGIVDNARLAMDALIKGDVEEFGYQHPEFAADPSSVLVAALKEAKSDRQTRDEYEGNLLPLVYGANRYAFVEAWASFESVATQLVSSP